MTASEHFLNAASAQTIQTRSGIERALIESRLQIYVAHANYIILHCAYFGDGKHFLHKSFYLNEQ